MTGFRQATQSGKAMQVVPVIQGESRVSQDPRTVFSTVLGSCVSVAMFDPVARVGGINHYLLPEAAQGERGNIKYGAMAIEVLINDLLKRGAARDRLRAKLCGGATIIDGLGEIGRRNADFAKEFMRREGFPVIAEDLGGRRARRLQFHPTSGEAQVYAVPSHQTAKIAVQERPKQTKPQSDVTLF